MKLKTRLFAAVILVGVLLGAGAKWRQALAQTPTTLTMPAFIMPYTDDTDNANSSTVWVPETIAVSLGDKTAHLTFYGYKSQAAYLRHVAGKGVQNIGQRDYDVTGTEFKTLFAAISTGTPTLATAIMTIPINRKDVAVLDAQGNAVLNTDGTPKMTSFFASATQTTISVPTP